MFVSTKNAFDFPFCVPPPFEDQAANDAFELDSARIGAQQLRIAIQYVEIGRCSDDRRRMLRSRQCMDRHRRICIRLVSMT
jgi:hypothetical protein